MLKVIVIDRCECCDGEAYVHAGEYKDGDVERPVYLACQACKGAGEREKTISLQEFADLLDRAELSNQPGCQSRVIRIAASRSAMFSKRIFPQACPLL